MISIKNKLSIAKMTEAGQLLANIIDAIKPLVKEGVSTLELDSWLAEQLKDKNLVSQTKGYMGYQHVSCISINDEVVHGVPSSQRKLKDGDFVKIDICAAWRGYCADMARIFFIGNVTENAVRLARVAQNSLDAGISMARAGNRLSDISAAIQKEVESAGYGVVRDFAGHGIGKHMHEDPEVLNYGKPGKGPVLRSGMALAIEPMITEKSYKVHVTEDGWTVKTDDKGLAAHVEDTIIITENEPKIITRNFAQSEICI